MTTKRRNRNYLRILLECCGAAALLLPASGLLGSAVPAPVPARQAASQDASSQAAKPNLAGTWKLNKDQSDDPRQKMQQAMGNSGDAGGGGGNPNRGEGRPGRGGGPGGMMAEWAQLTVTQLDANVKVTGASGRTLANTAPADNSAKSDDSNASNGSENENGGQRHMAPPPAEWQGSQLVANGRGFGGGSMTRTFELSPDGKQLYVTTKITSERLSQPVTYKLVYDKGSASGSNQ
jgi:hypothetical protein